MKFTVTFKDPDALHDAIDSAVGDEVSRLGLSAREAESVAEIRHEAVAKICKRWFAHGEYVDVEIDTDAATATVLLK